MDLNRANLRPPEAMSDERSAMSRLTAHSSQLIAALAFAGVVIAWLYVGMPHVFAAPGIYKPINYQGKLTNSGIVKGLFRFRLNRVVFQKRNLPLPVY